MLHSVCGAASDPHLPGIVFTALTNIFIYQIQVLDQCSTPSLLSLRLVNRKLSTIATPLAFRTIHLLEQRPASGLEPVVNGLRTNSLTRHIRELHIYSTPFITAATDNHLHTNLEALADILGEIGDRLSILRLHNDLQVDHIWMEEFIHSRFWWRLGKALSHHTLANLQHLDLSLEMASPHVSIVAGAGAGGDGQSVEARWGVVGSRGLELPGQTAPNTEKLILSGLTSLTLRGPKGICGSGASPSELPPAFRILMDTNALKFLQLEGSVTGDDQGHIRNTSQLLKILDMLVNLERLKVINFGVGPFESDVDVPGYERGFPNWSEVFALCGQMTTKLTYYSFRGCKNTAFPWKFGAERITYSFDAAGNM